MHNLSLHHLYTFELSIEYDLFGRSGRFQVAFVEVPGPGPLTILLYNLN